MRGFLIGTVSAAAGYLVWRMFLMEQVAKMIPNFQEDDKSVGIDDLAAGAAIAGVGMVVHPLIAKIF